MAKIVYSFFEVSCGEMKVFLSVAAIHFTWVNFFFEIFSALPSSGWYCDDDHI